MKDPHPTPQLTNDFKFELYFRFTTTQVARNKHRLTHFRVRAKQQTSKRIEGFWLKLVSVNADGTLKGIVDQDLLFDFGLKDRQVVFIALPCVASFLDSDNRELIHDLY